MGKEARRRPVRKINMQVGRWDFRGGYREHWGNDAGYAHRHTRFALLCSFCFLVRHNENKQMITKIKSKEKLSLIEE